MVCADRVLAWAERTAWLANNPSSFGADGGGGSAMAVEADVTREADCRRIVAAALAAFGRVDMLVNGVGMLGARGTAVDVDPQDWARGLETNVTSMMLMTKAAVPAMLRQPAAEPGQEGSADDGCVRSGGGSIVNIGSVAGLRGGTPHLLYPTSKGAVVNMTRAMAAHHAAAGIRVNCVCPGMSIPPPRQDGHRHIG